MRIRFLPQLCLAVLLAAGVMFGNLLLPAASVSAASSLTLSRTVAASGDRISAVGNGFSAGDDVVVSADLIVSNKAQHLQTSTTVGSNGVFSAILTLPGGTNQGTYKVTARDFHGNVATHALTVLPMAFVKAGATSAIAYVIPRHDFYVSGSGFGNGETVTIRASFALYNGNTAIVTRTRTTSSTGTFYESLLTTPRGAKVGIAALVVTGNTSHKAGRGSLHVFYHPMVSVGADTYRPGTAIHVVGAEYVPNTQVQVSVTIPRTDTTSITVSRTVSTDSRGGFSTDLPLPSDTALGKYSVIARETDTGFHAATTITVSVHPSILVKQGSVYPGQALDVSGSNFGTGSVVRVTGAFGTGGGHVAYVTRYSRTGGNGNYYVRLLVPGNAQAGTATITAVTRNARVATHVQILQRPTPVPTSTPAPKATATSAPTNTPTPSPTTVVKHHHSLGYRYISIWYHTMTEGTREHVVMQATLHTTLGIWVHVWFPNHQHYAYFQNTDSNGHWSMWFLVPRGSSSAGNATALVTFRLWHGKQNVKEYANFKIIK